MTLAPAEHLAPALETGFTAADMAAGRLPLTLGGETFVLPVRTIGENRAWRDKLDAAFPEETGDLEALLRAIADVDLLDHVYAYDVDGALPPRAELEPRIYPHELVRSIQLIRMASTPALSFAVGLMLDETRAGAAPNRSARRRTARTRR